MPSDLKQPSYEQLEAEVKRLRHREAFFNAIQEIANFGYCEWDYDENRIVSCTPAYAQIFGMSVEEAIESQSSWEKVLGQIHPDDRNHYSESYLSQTAAGSHEVEYRIFRKDGEIRYIKEVGIVVRDEQGKTREAIRLIQDVTDHATMRREIEENAAKLKLAARTAKLGYCHFDEDIHEYIDISEEYAEIFGYTIPEFLKRFRTLGDDMQLVHPEDRDALYQDYDSTDGKYDYSYRVLHRDGHWVHVREISVDIQNKEGIFMDSIGTLQDISELKAAELRAEHAREAAEAATRALDRELLAGAVPGAWNRPLLDKLAAYADGEPVDFSDVEIDLGWTTKFQRRVIRRCRSIPYGKTVTYGELASAAGSPGAARAVGSCMAANRFPLIVPCHRVVRSGGGIGAFSAPGGARTKRRMLAMESAS